MRPSLLRRFEITEHPWGAGNMAATGVQYATTINGNLINEANWTEVNKVTVNAFFPKSYTDFGYGELQECEIGFTVSLAVPDNSIAEVYWKVQGKNMNTGAAGVSWVDLCAKATQIADCTTAYDNTTSGLVLAQANFDRIPFEIRCVVNTNTDDTSPGTEPVRAKVKSSSYVRYVFMAD